MKLFNNLNDHTQFHARIRGDMMMASDSKKTLNYAEAWDYINVIAAHIQSSGIAKGDRVAPELHDRHLHRRACAGAGLLEQQVKYLDSNGPFFIPLQGTGRENQNHQA